MKNISCAALLIAALFTVSCSDVLETIPTDRLPSELYWKTEQDAEYAANAIYTVLEDFRETINMDGLSDIGHINFYANNWSYLEKASGDAQNGLFQDFWNKYYRAIRMCNEFMVNVKNVVPENEVALNKSIGEVRTLRAYFYFRMVSLYGDVPLVLTPITIKESKELTRTSQSEIWDFIEKELTEASVLLPATASQKGRFTKGAALSIKAKVMLYIGAYEKAAEAAKAVIYLKVYSLYPSYAKLFSYEAENSSEVIFGKQFVKDQYSNEVINTYGARSLGGNGSDLAPTRSLLDAYEMINGKSITESGSGYDPLNPYKDRDPRLSYSVFVPGDILPNGAVYDSRPFSKTADAYGSSFQASTTGFTPKKYMNKEDAKTPSNCGINLITMRYAEVLLMYAEAKIELNQIDESVLDAINSIRQRPDVNMPAVPSGLSQTRMREIVRHERLVELALEGVRYLDIKRWKIAEQVCNTPILGMSYINQDDKLIYLQDDVNPKRFDAKKNYNWAIPYNERLLNPKLEQNPGW